MINSAQIDTNNLLTILGIIAAVWALISPTNKLQFRFCMSWWDWFIGVIVFLLIHYLIFAPTLEKLGIYYSFGQWKWGLDSSSAVYLLLLCTAFYYFWRSKSPKLARGRIYIFLKLIDNLNLSKRYDELVQLVEPQLPKLISLTKQQPLIVRLVDHLDRPNIDINALLNGDTPKTKPAWREYLSSLLQNLKSRSIARDKVSVLAHEILLNLVTSPELTNYLALSHPHFCLKLIRTDEAIYSNFIEHYIDTLLEVSESRLYVELKNNQNLSAGSRLQLPESNRLLRFFFADANLAIENGLDKAIGEAVCRRLDEDIKLAEKLNKPLGSYYDTGRFRCPIHSGVTLFEIMVHEGIHQGLQDHMWLHYFSFFAEKILSQMPILSDEETHLEWPTPFHYLLSHLVSITTDWIEQCSYIKNFEIPEVTRSKANFDPHYISKESAKALGSMLECIIPNKKLSVSFKVYLLEIVIRSYVKLEKNPKIADVASSYMSSVIIGSDLRKTKNYYRIELWNIFQNIDHMVKMDAVKFEQAIKKSLIKE